MFYNRIELLGQDVAISEASVQIMGDTFVTCTCACWNYNGNYL